MQLIEIGNTCSSEPEKIRSVMFDSYTVEASVINVADFPPLRRSSANISESKSQFVGCVREGLLVAVAELERNGDGPTNIASFAVHPKVFRQGVGSYLLRQILLSARGRIIVSTAIQNGPAVALYKKYGFRIITEWRTESGIGMVTLESETTS